MHEQKVSRGSGAEPPSISPGSGAGEAREPSPEAAGFGRNAPPVPPAKTKQRLCLTKRQRRERPLRYHSSCPGKGATQACDVTVTPGGAYWGCGGKPAGLVGAAAPRGSSRRAAPSALPPKRAALCGGHAGYSSLSTQLSRIAIPYYRQFPDLSTTFPGKKAPVRSNPAHKAVKGATVTRPMEPTTVWISSEATYL